MKFAQNLSTHLTPEWRKYYIDYNGLKDLIYKMVRDASKVDLNKLEAGPVFNIKVDSRIQQKFLRRVKQQLGGVNSFFKAREADVLLRKRELDEEVEVLMVLMSNRRTKNIRSTRGKLRSLKVAVSEFYLQLSLLQNFQQLNHTGFRKILKKYDKLAGTKQGKEIFTEQVCKSYFWTSKKLNELIEETEILMIDKLEGGNRSKAMNALRVPSLADNTSPWVPLYTGWLMGAMFVSIIVIFLVIFALRPKNSWNFVTPTVRGLRIGFLLSIWFFGFAFNTYRWRKVGINNILIFEFNPRNYLNYVELFGVASIVGSVFVLGVLLTVFAWLGDYPEWVGALVMLLLYVALFALPLPVLYYRSRLWLTKLCGRVFLAPFFQVNFADFWIGDQMNSLVILFLDLEYFLCFLVYGLAFGSGECGSVKYGLRPLVALLPSWIRFAQCLRRYVTTRKAFPHLVNAGKYSTSFAVVFFSSLASGLKDPALPSSDQSWDYFVFILMWIVAGLVSTCYTFTWDIKMDWGLLGGRCKLREELFYRYHIYYWLALFENLIFRFLWMLSISVGEAGAHILEGNILGTILAVLEVCRRIIWNFFRLENEHLNNCGDFRVVRDISIHPVKPDEIQMDDEEGVELVLQRHLGKKVSLALAELHDGPAHSDNMPKLLEEETTLDDSREMDTMAATAPLVSLTTADIEVLDYGSMH